MGAFDQQKDKQQQMLRPTKSRQDKFSTIQHSQHNLDLRDSPSSLLSAESSSYDSDILPTNPMRMRSPISPRMNRIVKPFLFAIDFFVLLFVLQVVIMYLLSDGHETLRIQTFPIHDKILLRRSIPSSTNDFQTSFIEAPSCDSLNEDEVTFSLAIPLKEEELNMVGHHCKRWGIHAPISIAVWTTLSPDEVMDTILAFPSKNCEEEQLTITTLSPPISNLKYDNKQIDTYPVNHLRNLAIQAATTTHVIVLDIHMWASLDLFEILNTTHVLELLIQNPKLAVVIPAFEMNVNHEDSHNNSPIEYRKLIPGTYDELIIRLGEHYVFPMDPMDYSRQGSTNYKAWIKQSYSNLLDIDCISSNHYQPFVVVRYCQELPPFQENIQIETRRDNNDEIIISPSDSSWVMHLIRSGYTLQQLGGAFVVYLSPSIDSVDVKLENSKDQEQDKHGSLLSFLFRTQPKDIRRSLFMIKRNCFLQWLKESVANAGVVPPCPDYEEATDVV